METYCPLWISRGISSSACVCPPSVKKTFFTPSILIRTLLFADVIFSPAFFSHPAFKNWNSFAAQCDHRIDARGSPRREIAGENRRYQEHDSHSPDGSKINRADLIQN